MSNDYIRDELEEYMVQYYEDYVPLSELMEGGYIVVDETYLKPVRSWCYDNYYTIVFDPDCKPRKLRIGDTYIYGQYKMIKIF